MVCDQAKSIVLAYADGELDLVRSLEMEKHLQSCTNCSTRLSNLRALHQVLAQPALYHAVPEDLRARIRAATTELAQPSSRYRLPWRALAIAALVLLAVAAPWTIYRIPSAPSASEVLVQQLAAAHVRSMMAAHLTDVESTSQHTVKPWFNGKLSFSPPVLDLAEQGFPLLGGRLDYVDDHPAAALVYKRRLHVINLFIWPASDTAGIAPAQAQYQGYHVLHWTDSGMNFWAISDVNPDDLKHFAELFRGPRPATQP